MATASPFLHKRPAEALTRELVLAAADVGNCRTAFRKLRHRGSIDFAVLSVAVALWLDGPAVRRARILLGAVASWPLAAAEAAAAVKGSRSARRPSGKRPASPAGPQRRWTTPISPPSGVERTCAAPLREAAGPAAT